MIVRTGQGYPDVVDGRPQLAWKPSTAAGVTYDVAIYESLTLTVDLPTAPRARGALVAYAEALPEPSFKPQQPLAPGKRYMWSVRLRNGDTVTSWSTTGYYAVIAGGSGHWFGFATGEK